MVDPGVKTASASVTGTYVVHDGGGHSSGSISRSVGVDVTQPLLTLAVTATPNSGIVPLKVSLRLPADQHQLDRRADVEPGA